MRKLLFIVSIMFCCSITFGQRAWVELDTHRIRIGEQTTLHLFLEYPNADGSALLGWPQFDEQLTEDIEIVDKTIDYEELTDSAAALFRREQKLKLTVFEPGIYVIPPIPFEFNDTLLNSDATELLVGTVEVDTSKGIVDIKPNYEVDYTFGEQAADWFRDNWIWLAILAGIIALYFVYRFWKNRKTETELIVPKVIIPAHITALQVLNALKVREEWRSNDKKGFYSDMTDTVRRYLEERFGIFAMEQTTREIINDLANADISEEDKSYLRQILNRADMVKFAKFKPNDEDGQSALDHSIDFVERTKKEEKDNE